MMNLPYKLKLKSNNNNHNNNKNNKICKKKREKFPCVVNSEILISIILSNEIFQFLIFWTFVSTWI